MMSDECVNLTRMKSIAVFLVLFFALFSPAVSAQQSGASNNDALDKQKVKYKVWIKLLADDRQLESIYLRDVNLYSTGDSSIVVSKSQKWFYPSTMPTEIIPAEKIWEIGAKKRGNLGKSVLIGTGMGFVFGVASFLENKKPDKPTNAGILSPGSDAGKVGGVLMVLSGAFIGTLVGVAGQGRQRISIKGKRANYTAQREKLKRLSITGQ